LDVVDKDPEDNMFIECAVALKAEFIITGDKALKAIQKYMNIKIVTPKEFLSGLKEPKRQTISSTDGAKIPIFLMLCFDILQ
jgi:predicted nucleic acid-binding protein